ncbi:MAG: flagellar hook-associated protein FlgL [Herbaspirillum sp.]
MRISTSMLYQLNDTSLLGKQESIVKLRQQINAGQKVVTPSDDPIGASRALDLSQTQALNTQYRTNRNNADSSLGAVSAALSRAMAIMTQIKVDVIRAGDGAFSNAERNYMAIALQGNLEELLGLANTTDGMGGYVFAGFKSATQPFTLDAMGNIVYNGDQGVQTLQVDATRQIEVSVSGQAVFQGNGQDTFRMLQDLITVLSTPTTEAGDNADVVAADTFEYPSGSGQYPIAAYKAAQAALDVAEPTDPNYAAMVTQTANAKLLADEADVARTPMAGSHAALTRGLVVFQTSLAIQMTNVEVASASVGARQIELDNLDAQGYILNEQYTKIGNDLLGRDISDTIDLLSQLTLQQQYLQTAQKVFASTSNLTLLNYLR